MFKKGQRVRVKPYRRTRTIFNNADCFPGETKQYPGGWTGVVTDLARDGYGGVIVTVLRDGTQTGWHDFSENELEPVETTR